jgi:guanine deaminase
LTDQEFMELAIFRAREGIFAGQSPFGAVLALEGRVIGATHNRVLLETDPTAHAEVNCLRESAKVLATIDLSGATLYSTCEPCPMCLAAIHWAKVARLVYGASIADSAVAGFNELPVAARDLARLGGSPLIVEGGLLVEECVALFREWKAAGLGRSYRLDRTASESV